MGRSLILIPGGHRNKTPAPPGCGYVRLSLLAAAVSRAQLREGSAPSNHDFDSTPAGVCVTVKRGLWMAARGCEARSPRHAGPRSLVTASASRHDSPAAGGWGSCGTYAASIPSGFPPGLIGGIMGHAHRPPDKAMKPSPAAALSRSASRTAGHPCISISRICAAAGCGPNGPTHPNEDIEGPPTHQEWR